MRIAILDHRIEATQEVTIGAGDFGRVQGIEDRFVVLVDQYGAALPGFIVHHVDQVAESRCRTRMACGNSRFVL